MLTEYRVDGGPWTTYESKDEQIFDGTAASMAQWKQAGAGQLRPGSTTTRAAFLDPVGGLGMLWYPKLYGDYKRLAAVPRGPGDQRVLQRRRVRPLPEPGAEPADRRVRQDGLGRHRRRLGGHLLRSRDPDLRRQHGLRRARPARSTRSTTTTSTRSVRPSRAASGRTTRSRSRASSITIRRNGTVIKEFENTPGKQSDRSGDPITTLRQFAQGYIGLQNHGGADRIQYRDIQHRGPLGRCPRRGRGQAVHGHGQGPAHARGPLDRRGRPPGGQEDVRARDRRPDASGRHRRRRRPPPTQQPQVLVPQVISPIIPPMVQSPATASFGTVSSKISRETFAKKRRGGADHLHGRDGRHGEADGQLQGGQAAQAGPDHAGVLGRHVLRPALDQGAR